MAILKAGILGSLRGKVAGVVGCQWKNVNYIREYVQPANPNTAAQQTQRTKMSDTVAFSKPLVGPVFNAYTDRFQKAMSGFNRFIKTNIAEFDGSPDYEVVKLTEGKLSNIGITGITYNPGAGTLVFVFTTAYGNNGASDDQVFAAGYDESTGIWVMAAAEVDRDSLGITVPMAAGLTFGNIHGYIWCARYTNTLVTLISDSGSSVVAEGV